MTYGKILDEQIDLLFGKKKDSTITLQHGNETQTIVLDDLDMTQLQNIRYILEQNAKNLRQEILGGLPLWRVEKAWTMWREINRQIDMISNCLACRERSEC